MKWKAHASNNKRQPATGENRQQLVKMATGKKRQPPNGKKPLGNRCKTRGRFLAVESFSRGRSHILISSLKISILL